jgi:squalene-associated FAD-dependent desaturase
MKLAVIGGGWAGLAAAVRATAAGHEVTLIEMAPQLGGRARSVTTHGRTFDNGQHILVGAYRRTRALLAELGGSEDELFLRRPLELRFPDGRGLRLPAGPAWFAFVRAVAGCVGWTWADRAALVRMSAGWALDRFRCAETLTVEQLCNALPPAVRRMLIDPLCVAALNTPARDASAAVMLRVLRDALFGGRDAADLLLPRAPLSQLLPALAERWLAGRDVQLRLSQRVAGIAAAGPQWAVDGERFDAVVLAAAPWQSARLAEAIAPAWAHRAAALRFEPIVTVYVQADGVSWPLPMLALEESPKAPAQFAFDHGQLAGSPGRFAFVISGARAWAERGSGTTAVAVLDQAKAQLPAAMWAPRARILEVLIEKRATFACTPALMRPAARVAPGLVAAGDYVQGPYPATLEGAVRSGENAARLLGESGR